MRVSTIIQSQIPPFSTFTTFTVHQQPLNQQEMESLAKEKILLEQKLAAEKEESINEKENLSDQLKHSLRDLKKFQSMYEVSVYVLYERFMLNY